MNWLEIAVVTDGEAAEAIAEMLQPFAADGIVVMEQLGDSTQVDVTALREEITVKIYLEPERDTEEIRQKIAEILYHMARLYPIPAPTFTKLVNQDWAHAWKENYKPFRLGKRLWIQPSWIETGVQEPDDIVLLLDPGMAFGTGLHPTTQHCLQRLEELVKDGDSVLDVGTGSGILAIAAAKLGAGKLLGIDNDPIAIEATIENAALNDVTMGAQVALLDEIEEKGWDLVVVNILAPVIIKLLGNGLMEYVGENGRLILSGILEQQIGEMEAAIAAAGGQIEQMDLIKDWACFVVGR